jgi:beta-phosphoglucomutase-like phosphatase (HAD superfamily)
VRRWLGADFPRLEELLRERLELFLERVGDGRTIGPAARAAVRAAAGRVPVAVVSGAFRVEVEGLLKGAGLATAVSAIVALEDAGRQKPDPAPYLLAASRLAVGPEEIVAFEDTAVGVASAKAAGLRCIAVLGTQAPERLGEADEIVPVLDGALVERVLSPVRP